MIQGFLIGVIATASFTAGLFFLKFWRQTRDSFFLAFGASFLLEALNRLGTLFLDRPNTGDAAIYSIRLVAFLLILMAILKKNYGRNP